VSSLKFNVVFEDAGDGWVYAHVQELPEVHTQGESLDDARSMVREAIELVLKRSTRARRGDPGDWMDDRGARRDRCVKKRDLERHPGEHGCSPARQASKHEVWENSATGQGTTIPRHREIKPPTARGICRQFGVPAPAGSR
jgi:predicted RNase H-like HicB family nuclease